MTGPLRRLAGLFLVVRRSLRQHALSTVVTALSVALGAGLVMAVFVLSVQSRRAFAGGSAGFDGVLGARGSPLQLVLNSVFHLEISPGNIPWRVYEKVKGSPMVEAAVPYVVGDNYRGFRVVGTTPELFTTLEVRAGEPLRIREGGRVFDPELREAVIGYTVAQRTGLNVRSHFHPSHEVAGDVDVHEDEFLVVGVLERTDTPSDLVVWTPVEASFRMEDHVLRGTGTVYRPKDDEEIPDEHKEVSAVMLRYSSPAARFGLQAMLAGEETPVTLAPIGEVMLGFLNRFAWVNRVLEMVAYLVVVVAAGSILASIHNTMNERRREFAILRALGARRRTVFGVIVLESSTIALVGSLLGYGAYAAILTVASEIVRRQTGVVLDPMAYHPALLWTPVGMVVVGGLAGVLPAMRAYRTDVAEGLTPAT